MQPKQAFTEPCLNLQPSWFLLIAGENMRNKQAFTVALIDLQAELFPQNPYFGCHTDPDLSQRARSPAILRREKSPPPSCYSRPHGRAPPEDPLEDPPPGGPPRRIPRILPQGVPPGGPFVEKRIFLFFSVINRP
jgi:hypothetical protein